MIRSHFSQAAKVATSRPAYAAGLRAAIATVAPIVAGQLFGWPGAMWMGLAGFNVALSDKGGTLRTRLTSMLAPALYGALAAVAGAFAGRYAWMSIPLVALWAFAAGMARTWGAIATTTGIISFVTFIVSLEVPAPTMAAALERGLAILAGSAFAMALALLVWPVRIYRPVRRAVARAYRVIAAAAISADRSAMNLARQEIDDARMALASLRRGLNGETPRGERLLVLAETADRLLSSLEREAPQPDIAPALEAIARTVETERNDEPGHPTVRQPGNLEIAKAAAAELNDDELRHRQSTRTLAQRYVDPIVKNLDWSSVVMRHALRVAVAAAAAEALATQFHIPRRYWVTLTVIIILQPHTSSTFQRGLQRLAGTILGGIVAALLLGLVHSPVEMTVVVFIGAALTVALLPVNYGLYSLFLTPTFILLAEVSALDRSLVSLRINNTLLGAAIAYLSAWVLWPASERGRVRDDLAAALRELAEYTRCIGECDDQHAADARRAFIVALENGEASLQRLLTDRASGETEILMTLLVYLRRYAIALSALLAATEDRLRLGIPMRYASTILFEIASALDAARAPAPPGDAAELRSVDGAERLLDALAALHAAATRLGEWSASVSHPIAS